MRTAAFGTVAASISPVSVAESTTSTKGGVELHRLRQGKHEVWPFGNERLIIPRHSDIDGFTAAAILHQA